MSIKPPAAPQVPFKVKTSAYMGHQQLVCIGQSIGVGGMQICAPVQETLGQYMRLVFNLDPERTR